MKRIAMLLAQDFEDSEAHLPYQALKAAGHRIDVVSPQAGETIVGEKGQCTLQSDCAVAEARAEDYDMLVIPGGGSPGKLRKVAGAVRFVQKFGYAGKLIAAMCHGPQMLIWADLIRGRQITCSKSIAVDLKNAGAQYVDRALAMDGPFITSQHSTDLPQFCEAILRVLRGHPALA